VTETAGSTPSRDALRVLPQYLLPQHLLTRCAHHVARCRVPFFKNFLIERFIRRYGVDMGDAESGAASAYPHFNAFFTRALRPDARPISPDPGVLVSPVDGEVSQSGAVTGGRILQAKGRDYTVAELLGSETDAARFGDGRFATLYLAPHDYHRIHMPAAGRLESMRYIPGRLFSVNAATTAAVNRLFARNERVVCRFATGAGAMIVCMVGALIVGGIETVWHGAVTASGTRRPHDRDYTGADAREFRKGDEIGRFNVGSTVILLFEPDAVEWDPWLTPGTLLKFGQRIGKITRRA
jgi:phosphatidylserine decarboxylase